MELEDRYASLSSNSESSSTNLKQSDESTDTATRDLQTTPAEEYKKVVLSNTDGLFAHDRINNMPFKALFAYRQNVCKILDMGGTAKEFAEQLEIHQQMDSKLAHNMANGLMKGTAEYGCE